MAQAERTGGGTVIRNGLVCNGPASITKGTPGTRPRQHVISSTPSTAMISLMSPLSSSSSSSHATPSSTQPSAGPPTLAALSLSTSTSAAASSSSAQSDLLLNEKFLSRLFWYFYGGERRGLAQVCHKWRQVLYQPCFWEGITPVLHCSELYRCSPNNVSVPVDGSHSDKQFVSLNSFSRCGFDSFCLVGVSDLDICEFIDNYPLAKRGLRSLSLKRSTITDAGLEVLLEQMQDLVKLELSGCNDFTEAGLWSGLNGRLEALSLSDCINVADDAIAAITHLLPRLSELSLQAYHVTDAGLACFSSRPGLPALRLLQLHSCWEVTDRGAASLSRGLPVLRTLSLSGCSKLTDEGVEAVVSGMRNLRSLDLSWCPQLSDITLEALACELPGLQEIVLDRCVRITDTGLGYLSTMPSLRALYLRWCCQVQDFGLQHLYSMRNLRILSLAGCPLLSTAGLSGLVQMRDLEELELTNCPGATPDLFPYLARYLPHCLIIE
uniref:F-box/LRR-repeat protein 16 n=1 Tax=Myxine glutinosa TaxID=7769 RepID=UPI00358ECD7A